MDHSYDMPGPSFSSTDDSVIFHQGDSSPYSPGDIWVLWLGHGVGIVGLLREEITFTATGNG